MYQSVPTTGLKPSAEALEVETPAPPSKFKRYGRDAAIALALLLSASAAYVSLSKPSSSNLRAGAAETQLSSASCPDPYHWTSCVKSQWGALPPYNAYQKDEKDFQRECNGNLVNFDDNDYVKDCNIGCFACSWIKACCDTCETILAVDQSWEKFKCTDLEADLNYEWGVKVTESDHWKQTDDWSRDVSLKATASGVIEGVKVKGAASAEQARSVQTVEEQSWSKETSSKTKVSYTQPADTCTWRWKTVITDSCGTKVAYAKSISTTWGPNSKDPTGAAHPESADVGKGNPPCCMPDMDPEYVGDGKFKCPPYLSGPSKGLTADLC